MVAGPSYVYVAIPRTASVAVAQGWLIPRCGGVEVHSGLHHLREIPDEHRGKHVFTIVRNPRDRLFSLWCLVARKKRGSFLDFLEQITDSREHRQYKKHRIGESYIWRNQVDFLRGVAVDAVLRYEDLPECLETLPFVDGPVELPLIPQQVSKFRKRVLFEEEEALVQRHSGPDFEAFGYE